MSMPFPMSVSAGKSRKRGADATTITLSISGEDKALVKAIAAKRNVTVSDLLHGWIVEAAYEDAAAEARAQEQRKDAAAHGPELSKPLFQMDDRALDSMLGLSGPIGT